MIKKLTKRDMWAFCVGQSSLGLTFGYIFHSPAVFLLNATILAYDVWQFIETLPKEEIKQ